MTGYSQVLRRVGWVLIAVGLIDIGLMIYFVANERSYSSSLNIFAVIAGVFLLRGHLGAARVVTWFSAFLFTGLTLCVLCVFPWMQPLDYWTLLIRQDPLATAVSFILAVAVLCMLYWVFRQLRSPPVLEAQVLAGHRANSPRSAFLAGVALALLLAVTLQLTLKGETAQEAKRLAAQQYGHEYRYFVSSINWSSGQVSARLTAYKNDEIKEVAVQWQR